MKTLLLFYFTTQTTMNHKVMSIVERSRYVMALFQSGMTTMALLRLL